MSPRTHEVPDELLSSLLVNYTKPEDLIGENGLLKQLTKRLVERALDAEMTEHLGHDKHEPVANAAGNTRNGRSRKTLKGEFGELPIEMIGENGLLKQLTKRLVERALDAEMTEHLGHDKHEPVANAAGHTRNGRSRKTLKGEFGELPIEIPRDRHGSFAPQLIPKHQTRWAGFDDKILSLYARGMTVREIQSHLEEMYGTEVSPRLI
ncbi:transposase, partial [Xanthomonas citri]|uniref:transposase n=1 Tax=Xanthomonas citri TaxID=346 RepID=UPI0013E02ADA